MSAARILLADDDENIRLILTHYLEAHGYSVVVALNGTEAVQKVETDKPDLVILDMSMPQLDGWGVARRLRQTHSSDSLPILALTAHVLADVEVRTKEAGCDAFLGKPFQPNQVLQEVQRLLSRPS